MATPNMNLNLPIPNVTSGVWGDMLNTAFGAIDAHDHSAGSGLPLTGALAAEDGGTSQRTIGAWVASLSAWRPMKVIFDRAVVIPATPDAVLIDEEIDLVPYGLVSSTYCQANTCVIIEKPDGLGGWVPTFESNNRFINEPPLDPGGYEVSAAWVTSPMARPFLPGGDPLLLARGSRTVGQETGNDWFGSEGACPLFQQNPEHEDQVSRLRVYVTRTPTTYSPAEQAIIDAYGYRVRVAVHAPDLIAWERSVPLGGAEGDILFNEVVDFADFGLLSDGIRFRFVAEFLRDGKTIRSFLPEEYTSGEAFDPPAPSVRISAIGLFPNTSFFGDQNGEGDFTYPVGGGGTYEFHIEHSGYQWSAGTLLSPDLGYCAESVKQQISVTVERQGERPSTYADGEMLFGSAEVTWALTGNVLTALEPGPRGAVVVYFDPDGGGGTTAEPLLPPTYMFGGVRVHYTPGVSTLQSIWTAIDGLNPAESRVATGILTNPTDDLSTLKQWVRLGETSGSYEPLAGLVIKPTPPETGNCTLRLRLLVAPPNKVNRYPFNYDDTYAQDSGFRSVRLAPVNVPVAHHPTGLWRTSSEVFLDTDALAFKKVVPIFLAEQTGTGEPQTFSHGLSTAPLRVEVTPLQWPAGSECAFTATSDATEVTVAMTSGVVYRVSVVSN